MSEPQRASAFKCNTDRRPPWGQDHGQLR
jgi:hypothetical protein